MMLSFISYLFFVAVVVAAVSFHRLQTDLLCTGDILRFLLLLLQPKIAEAKQVCSMLHKR